MNKKWDFIKVFDKLKSGEVMKKSHEPILGAYRNNWYNEDYLDLLAKRLRLSEVKDVLDVGCGKFHWTSLLVKYLNENTYVTGIDINPLTYEEISKLDDKRIRFIEGNSEELPFKDNSFDMVTCQTLLIHLKDPIITLKEMNRVLRNNGLICISEPNNLSQSIFRNSYNINENLEERNLRIIEKMKSEEKKIIYGNGDNSLGELVPILLEEAGFKNINCYVNDKMNIMKPPYESNEEKSKIEMLKNLVTNYPYELSESEIKEIEEVNEMIKNQEFVAYNPTMLFISTGRKIEE